MLTPKVEAQIQDLLDLLPITPIKLREKLNGYNHIGYVYIGVFEGKEIPLELSNIILDNIAILEDYEDFNISQAKEGQEGYYFTKNENLNKGISIKGKHCIIIEDEKGEKIILAKLRKNFRTGINPDLISEEKTKYRDIIIGALANIGYSK